MNAKTVVMCLVGLVLIFSVHVPAKGSIKFKATSLSFGEIDSGQVADLQFEFTNIGDSPLIIQRVHSTCGCTVSQLKKKEYLPGESGVIPVRFFSRGYQGRVIKSLSVTSNDSENAQIRLQITGVVKVTDFADIEVLPREILLGKLPLGKAVRRKVTIKNPGNLELRIAQVSHSPDLYLVFPQSLLAPGQSMEVDIVYNPNRLGMFSTHILMTSNALGKGQEMIRVNAEVVEN